MKILVVVSHYLPGYKAGGPIRTVANIIEKLGDEFEFYVVTSDRDLGDTEPYADVKQGDWKKVGKAHILYLAPTQQSLLAWRRLLRTLDYDLIYLNGFFLPLTVRTLWLRKMGQIPDVPVILAPRGEFSPGAVALKAYKKRPYLFASNLLNFCKDVVWHASSEYEAQDIRREFFGGAPGVAACSPHVRVAINLAAAPGAELDCALETDKVPGELRIIFLSRVSRKKNLDFALRLLKGIQGSIQFDIFGPVEDEGYWQECKRLIADLPTGIEVRYRGVVPPDQVTKLFSHYHLFLFPTRGENFGHVILESLLAGCPVLLSDQTPWRDLEQKGVGWDLPLSEPEQFRAVLRQYLAVDESESVKWAVRARRYGLDYLREQESALLQIYRELFLEAGK